MTVNRLRDRDSLWLWLCLGSLAVYMLHSEAIPAFVQELTRLMGQI
jgi:hypothetical protein